MDSLFKTDPGLDESKTILTLETTNLQPDTEYKIAFRTVSK